MKKLVIALLLGFNLNAQIDSLALQDSQKKIELDTKVEMSRNYFLVLATILVGGVLLNKGELNGKRILSEKAAEIIMTNQYPEEMKTNA